MDDLDEADWPIESEVSAVRDGKRFCGRIFRWDESPENPNEVSIKLILGEDVFEARSEQGYFRALCNIRVALEARNILLECYGSSVNVYPSPMIEAMGYAERAYKLTMAKPALSEDLVSIFDTGSDIKPASVQLQKEFYDRWLKSMP